MTSKQSIDVKLEQLVKSVELNAAKDLIIWIKQCEHRTSVPSSVAKSFSWFVKLYTACTDCIELTARLYVASTRAAS